LLQKANGQHLLPAIFRIHHDLREDSVVDIRIGFGDANRQVNILARKFGQEIEGDIIGRLPIKLHAIGIFFYDDWAITILFGVACHDRSLR
jgi:hypothetical protein